MKKRKGLLIQTVAVLSIAFAATAGGVYASAADAADRKDGGKFVAVYENDFKDESKYALGDRSYQNGVLTRNSNMGTMEIVSDGDYGKAMKYTKADAWHRPAMRVQDTVKEGKIYEISYMAKIAESTGDVAYQPWVEVTDNDGWGTHNVMFGGDWYDYLVSSQSESWTEVRVYFQYVNDGENYVFRLAKTDDFESEGNYVEESYPASKSIAAIELEFTTAGSDSTCAYYMAELKISQYMTKEELASFENDKRVFAIDFTKPDSVVKEKVGDAAAYPGKIVHLDDGDVFSVVEDDKAISGKALDIAGNTTARMRLGNNICSAGKTYRYSYRVKMTASDKFNGNFGMCPLLYAIGSDGKGNYVNKEINFDYNYLGSTIQSSYHENYFEVTMYWSAEMQDGNLVFKCYNGFDKAKKGEADAQAVLEGCDTLAAMDVVWWKQGGSSAMPWRLADVSVSEFVGMSEVFSINGSINEDTRVTLIDKDTLTAIAYTNAEKGAFRFENVLPGTYLLRSETTGRIENLFVEKEIVVGEEELDVEIRFEEREYSVTAEIDEGVVVNVYAWNGLDAYESVGVYTQMPVSLKKGAYLFAFSKDGYKTLCRPALSEEIENIVEELENAVVVEADVDLGKITLEAIPSGDSSSASSDSSASSSSDSSVNDSSSDASSAGSDDRSDSSGGSAPGSDKESSSGGGCGSAGFTYYRNGRGVFPI